MALWPESITIDFSPGNQDDQEYNSTIDLQRHKTQDKEVINPGVDLSPGIHLGGLGLFSPYYHYLLPYLCHVALRDNTNKTTILPAP